MDIAVAKRFAEYYPNFDKCLIQVFDDVETRKDKKLAREALRWNDKTIEVCESSNNNWCGIFFSVNQITWDKRRQANVSEINTRVVEIDHLSKEEQMKLIELSPIQPSCAVESKRSFHFYWFAKDWKKENWRKIMWWLRNFFQWDHKIITEERVLRIPWFDHCKTLEDKYETTYRPLSWKQYTEEEMLKAFPDTTNKKEQEKKMKSFANTDDFRKRACSVNSEYMLTLLSWTKRVNWEVITIEWWQIFINWKSTSSWIDKNWLIWSYDNWWPTRTQWISWYWTVDRKELYERLINKMPELKPKEIKKEEKQIVVNDDFFVEYDREHKTDYNTVVPFTFGNTSVDEYFWRIERGRFMTTIWESWSWKTTRAFHQWIEISRNFRTLFISLEMTWERVVELRARKMSWITHKERDDKLIPQWKKHKMEEYKKEITNNKNLQIVWVNRKVDSIDVRMVVEGIKKKYMDYDWIIIDNLWFITCEWEKEWYQELNAIVREFKNFCHEHNKNINLLHHFNKWNSKARKDRDRTFADVLGTGKLEHDVDYWVFISRYLDKREELTEEQKQEVFIKLAKDRDHGEIKMKLIYFYKGRYYDTPQNSMF